MSQTRSAKIYYSGTGGEDPRMRLRMTGLRRVVKRDLGIEFGARAADLVWRAEVAAALLPEHRSQSSAFAKDSVSIILAATTGGRTWIGLRIPGFQRIKRPGQERETIDKECARAQATTERLRKYSAANAICPNPILSALTASQ